MRAEQGLLAEGSPVPRRDHLQARSRRQPARQRADERRVRSDDDVELVEHRRSQGEGEGRRHQPHRIRQGRRDRVPDAEQREAAVRRPDRAPGRRQRRRRAARSTRSGTRGSTRSRPARSRRTTRRTSRRSTPHQNLKRPRQLAKEYEQKHGEQAGVRVPHQPGARYSSRSRSSSRSRRARRASTCSIRTVDQSTLINEALAGNFQGVGFAQPPGWRPRHAVHLVVQRSPVNFGRIKDPEIDRLLDEGRSEPDPAKRTAIYKDLSRRFAKELYNLWSWYTSGRSATRRTSRASPDRRCPTAAGKPFAVVRRHHPDLGHLEDLTPDPSGSVRRSEATSSSLTAHSRARGFVVVRDRRRRRPACTCSSSRRSGPRPRVTTRGRSTCARPSPG